VEIQPELGEEFEPLVPDYVVFGCRLADGFKVVAKKMLANSNEYQILRFVNSQELRCHPDNHCISVLEDIDVEDGYKIIVFAQHTLLIDPVQLKPGCWRVVEKKHIKSQ